MLKSLIQIFSKPSNIASSIAVFLITAILMLSFPHLSQIVKLGELFPFFSYNFWHSLLEFWELSFVILGPLAKLIFILFLVATSLNIVVFVVYLKRYRKKIQGAQAHLSVWGLLLAVFGTGCLSCSVIILAPLASIFGLSTATWFAQHSVLVSFGGLILVLLSLYLLLKKLNDPEVCKVLL